VPKCEGSSRSEQCRGLKFRKSSVRKLLVSKRAFSEWWNLQPIMMRVDVHNKLSYGGSALV
jgi:hypothetical protein